jgi:hypothetical protein
VNNFSRALFVGVATCCAQAVSAQSVSDQVRGCAAQADTGARLACYDQLAASLGKGAAVSGAAVEGGVARAGGVGPAAQRAAMANDAGGGSTAAATQGAGLEDGSAAVSPPSPDAQFGIAGGKLEQRKEAVVPKEIQAVVSGVARRPRGELVITLDNGQVWAQLAPQEYYPLKIGDTVHISKGALGSYSLTTPAKRGSKVTRLL